jgi:hypothetical protein
MDNLILSIDPGPETSGFVILNTSRKDGFCEVDDFNASIDNWVLLRMIFSGTGLVGKCGHGAIEDIVSYGQIAGNTTINTAKWVGRFDIGWRTTGKIPRIISRNDVKIVLCGTRTVVNNLGSRVAVSQKMLNLAVCQKFEPYGGGKNPYKGTKKKPGPLYGLKSHSHSALALAVVCYELISDEKRDKVRGTE